MPLTKKQEEHWGELLDRVSDAPMSAKQRSLTIKAIAAAVEELDMGDDDPLSDFPTGEDFRRADEEAKKSNPDLDEMNRKAKQRIELGEWLAKKWRKYPKSAWWMVGCALIGIGTSSFVTWVGGGIIVLVIAHMAEN